VPGKERFRHVGGGQKGLYLLLRYVFIATASYLLIFHARPRSVATLQAAIVALALASNVALSALPVRTLFAWWITGPLLVADTVWVTWALHAGGRLGEEFFLIYLIVLVLAAVSENTVVVVVGASIASLINLYAGWRRFAWTSPELLRVVFLFTAAVFYGHALGRVRAERRRGDRSLRWARTLEAKVAQRTSELHRLYEGSRAASDAKTEFLAVMSHEVRTPLHIVVGYAEMLLDGAATTPEHGAALGARIRGAATTLLSLVDGLLEFGRLRSGTVQIEKRPVTLASFLADLAQREWIEPHPGVTLRWQTALDAVVVNTDASKLASLVSNVVTNALKYTRVGEVVVSARTCDARAEIQVADTGPGIPPERLARMRDPFHESTGEGHRLGGVGLGLALVYRYADVLGADIRVSSTIGCGTVFVVTLPIESGTSSCAATRTTPSLDEVSPSSESASSGASKH
jgi:signal transduction histidine kinase